MSKKPRPEGWQRRFVDPPYSTQWATCNYQYVLENFGARGLQETLAAVYLSGCEHAISASSAAGGERG